MRAAVSSHSAYPPCSAEARPVRSRSVSRCSSSPAPALIRSARRSALRRAASGSAAACAPDAPAARFSSVRFRRPASHSSAQSGAWPGDGTAPSSPAQSSSSPSACLHGNLRLGQLHLYAGPAVSAMSTTV